MQGGGTLANKYVAIAGGTAGNTVVQAFPGGCLAKVIVTVTGANPMNIFDNATTASGTIIGALPASPTVGTVFTFDCPTINGITVQGSATNPGVVVTFL